MRIAALILLSLFAIASSESLRSLAAQNEILPTEDGDIEEVLEINEDPHEQEEKTDVQGHEIAGRIVGGSTVARGKYPWYVRKDAPLLCNAVR